MKTVTEYIRPLYVIVGLLITLSTAIIPVSHLAGSTDYGLPFSWLVKLILSPEHFPWRVNWIYLIIDISIWTTLCFAVQDLAPKFKHHLATPGQDNIAPTNVTNNHHQNHLLLTTLTIDIAPLLPKNGDFISTTFRKSSVIPVNYCNALIFLT